MKKTFFKTAGLLASLFPVRLWSGLTRHSIICPFYHTIEPNEPSMIRHLYEPLLLTRFNQDIDFFLKNFCPISAKDLYLSVLDENPIRKPSFFLSFDDGLREIYDIVFPVLQKKGITATVFVNTDFIDNKDLFYRYKVSLIIEAIQQQPQLEILVQIILNDFVQYETKNVRQRLLALTPVHIPVIDRLLAVCGIDLASFMQEKQPYLTWQQIQELSEAGWHIGSHGTNHTAFQELTTDDRINQLKQSFRVISQYVKQDFRMFAFPFTDAGINSEFIHIVFDQHLADIIMGGAGLYPEKLKNHIQRIPLEKEYASTARRIITSEYFYYFAKKMIGKKFVQR